MHATINEAVLLQLVSALAETTLFARAYIYSGSILLATVDLPHIAQGMYEATYTPLTEGYLGVVYKFFTDAGFTIPAMYDIEAEVIEVDAIKTNVLRILGLVHNNSVVDNQTYDEIGNLLTSRIRSYDSPINATIGSSTGLLFTWNLAVEYTLGRVSNFRIVQV